MTCFTRRRLLQSMAGAALFPALAGCAADGAAGDPPIDHLVVLLRENHSYDNYFGGFPGGNGVIAGERCGDERPDPPHDRSSALRGSFVDARGDCHYREEDIPRYFALARAFTLCDNYFGELLAPSVPNYFMLMAAESPLLENPQGRQRGRFTTPSIIDRLAARGIAWRNYDGGLPLVSLFAGAAASGNIVPEDTFFADARDGRLPAVSWLTPSIADSEHPAYSIRRGEEWTIRRINALMQSPLWPRLAAIVVWDEWGGFRDHVAPPVVERDAEYDVPLRYGYRVPCLVVGPYARRGYVSHTRYSHVSVLRTIERLFDLPPLTARDAAANDLLDCFDFAQPPQPPKLLPDET